MESKGKAGYPSVDKPWLKYYTEEAIHAPTPETSLYEYMYAQNRDHLSDVALNYFGRKFTYGELFQQIDAVAKAFRAQGMEEGDVCTIVTLSCVPSVLCLYGLNKIGAVSNYVNVLSSQEDLETYFRQSASETVVTLDLFGEKVLKAAKAVGVRRVIVYSLSEGMPLATKLGFRFKMRKVNLDYLKDERILLWRDFLAGGTGQPEINFHKSPDSLCCLAHTGGTTGFPKTVLISDQAMNILAQQYDKRSVHRRQQVFLSVMIPFVIYGTLSNIHMPLCLGLHTVLIPKFDPADWPGYIKRYRPQHLTAIPPYVGPMAEDKKLADMDLSCLITVGLGGDGLNIPLEEKLNAFLAGHGSSAKVVKGYGMTEVCATFSTCNNYANKLGSVGFRFATNNLMIYDNDRERELTYGEVGEICLQSASRMMGYQDNEEEMAQLIRRHSDGSEWIHTGDLGYVDEDGFLFLVGRMKRVILTTRGEVAYKVFPNIPEAVLDRHAGVHDTCIVGTRDGNDLVLKAFLVLSPEMRGKEEQVEAELRALCQEELSDYMQPRFYVFRTELPLTPAGKVDYRALEAEA